MCSRPSTALRALQDKLQPEAEGGSPYPAGAVLDRRASAIAQIERSAVRIAGSVTAGKSRASAIGTANADRDFPDVEERVAREPQRRGGPEQHAMLRAKGTDEERGADEQEDQPDIADEMLVERTGRRDAGHGEIPVGGRGEHEKPVCSGADAEDDGGPDTDGLEHTESPLKSRLRIISSAAAGHSPATSRSASIRIFEPGPKISETSSSHGPK